MFVIMICVTWTCKGTG